MASTAGTRPSGPVFVDDSGRRHRAVRRVGVLLALLGVVAGGLLTVLALAGAPIDAPGLPFLRHAPHAAVGRPPSRPITDPAPAVVPAAGATDSFEPTLRSSPAIAGPTTLSATPSAAPTHHAHSPQTARPSAAPSITPTSPTAKPTSRPSATVRGASSSAPGALLRRSHP